VGRGGERWGGVGRGGERWGEVGRGGERFRFERRWLALREAAVLCHPRDAAGQVLVH